MLWDVGHVEGDNLVRLNSSVCGGTHGHSGRHCLKDAADEPGVSAGIIGVGVSD